MPSTVEEAIYNYVSTISAFTAYVSTRIYYFKAYDEGSVLAKPYMWYVTIGNPFARQYFGTQKNGQARIQFNIVDDDERRALLIMKALKNGIQYQTGVLGSATVHFFEINNTLQNYNEETKNFTFVVDATAEYVEP